MILSDPARDVMIYDLPPDAPASENPWFDRFYFDLHAPAGQPFIVVGAAVYPGLGLADGYVVAVTDKEQRNLRVSDQFAPGARYPRLSRTARAAPSGGCGVSTAHRQPDQ